MQLPLEILKERIKEITVQLRICETNECDASEVRKILLQYRYAYQLLRDFGFNHKQHQHYKYNLAHKLTVDDVRYMRKYYNPQAGKYRLHSVAGLAKEFGVHQTTVTKILNYQTWKEAV